MVRLDFNSPEEFERLFRSKDLKVTDAIVSGIEEAMQSNKHSADLFEICFDESDIMYEISLPKKQWSIALQSCLDLYHQREETDKCIDTWKLLEIAKAW